MSSPGYPDERVRPVRGLSFVDPPRRQVENQSLSLLQSQGGSVRAGSSLPGNPSKADAPDSPRVRLSLPSRTAHVGVSRPRGVT
jgi:hypothetical protein